MTRLKGRARRASVIATNSADQSRPLRRPQAHALAVLVGKDAEAVVLQLMQPAVAVRHLGGEDRLARNDEAGRQLALRPDPAGGVRINMARCFSAGRPPKSLRQDGAVLRDQRLDPECPETTPVYLTGPTITGARGPSFPR